ncbi:MAG TPA: FAD-dependent oxidoreductase, partial [Phycisphaerales bacterium]|nr:FAD-dependent oxidoreductase [Phycisphaerales bacterium]
MPNTKNYNKVQVLIVGAGPAGLAAAIHLKAEKPEIEVCVIEKAADLGNHNLSGAVLEAEPLHTLLDSAVPGWRESEAAREVLASRIDKDDIMFFTKNRAINIFPMIKLAGIFRLGFGQMIHIADYSVQVSKLAKWLGRIAEDMEVEVLTGFAAEDIILDESTNMATGVKLVDQGRDKEGNKQPNFVEG